MTIGGIGQFLSYNFALGESAWQNKMINDFLPFGLHVKSLDEIYVVGQIVSSGTAGILKTTNLGENWGVFDTEIPGRLNEIVFLNDSVALIGGSDGLLIKWEKGSTFDFASIENGFDDVSIAIFPNPTNDLQYLKTPLTKPSYVEVDIINVTGERVIRVFQGELSPPDSTIEIDLSSLSRGIYFYSVRVDGTNFQKKIIKL